VKKNIPQTFLIFLFISTAILTACTSTPSNPRDPLEPMNRSVYKFNDKADRWVMKPVAQGYHNYTPAFLRTGVNNFFNNLADASSSVNYGLQGEAKPSLYRLSRFLLNSTVGLLGLLDVTAGHEKNYPQTGFGDTYAKWGWKNSRYLVIPLMGPSTLRDGTGIASGAVFQNHAFYTHVSDNSANAAVLISGVSAREQLLGVEDIITNASLDPYAYTRDAWLQIRAKKAGDDLPQVECR